MRYISTGLATVGLTIVVAYIHPRRVYSSFNISPCYTSFIHSTLGHGQTSKIEIRPYPDGKEEFARVIDSSLRIMCLFSCELVMVLDVGVESNGRGA